MTCSQDQPNRNRHCVLAIPWSGMTIPGNADDLPCAPSSCHLNVVMATDRSSAQNGDEVVMGSSDDNRNIHQGRSQLSSVLFTGSDRPLRSWSRSKPYKGKLKVQPDNSAGNPQVAYSLPYNITQRSSLIFAKSPGSVKPDGSSSTRWASGSPSCSRRWRSVPPSEASPGFAATTERSSSSPASSWS